MDQISTNTPAKTPVNSTNIETLDNIINTVIIVNSINRDILKDLGHHKSHT